MDENIILNAWEDFTQLEKRMKGMQHILPLTKEHFSVWSLELGSILLEAGSIFDSFLREGISSTELDACPSVAAIRKKDRKDINIADFAGTYNEVYKLSETKVYVKLLKDFLMPLDKWAIHKTPIWWDAYNNIKHDKYQYKKEATLEKAINSLASIFIVLTKHIPSRYALVQLEAIKDTKGQNYAKWFIKEQLSTVEGWSDNLYISESILFSYFFYKNAAVNEIKDEYIKYHNPFAKKY